MAGGGLLAVPAAVKAHKKGEVDAIAREVDSAIAALESTSEAARKKVETAGQHLHPREREDLLDRLRANDDAVGALKSVLREARDLSNRGRPDEARSLLRPSPAEKKEGAPAAEKAAALREGVQRDVIDFCEDKTALRALAERNAFELAALFSTPVERDAVETPSQLAGLPADLQTIVPARSASLEEGSRRLGLEPNALAARLVSSEPALVKAMAIASNDRVRATANEFFYVAKNRYETAQALYGELGASGLGGRNLVTLTKPQYLRLLEEQKRILDLVISGDAQLAMLKAYPAKLEEQYTVRVARHEIEELVVRRDKYVRKSYRDHNGKRKSRRVSVSDNSVGKGFCVVLETVTPAGTKEEIVQVGRKDSRHDADWREWEYDEVDEVGYVREWKRYGDDDAGILRGEAAKGATIMDSASR